MLIGDWCFPAEHSLNSELKLPHFSGPVAPPYPNLMKSVEHRKFLRLGYYEELELLERDLQEVEASYHGHMHRPQEGTLSPGKTWLSCKPLPSVSPLPPPLRQVEAAVHIKKQKFVVMGWDVLQSTLVRRTLWCDPFFYR